jgi:hypothetical protein
VWLSSVSCDQVYEVKYRYKYVWWKHNFLSSFPTFSFPKHKYLCILLLLLLLLFIEVYRGLKSCSSFWIMLAFVFLHSMFETSLLLVFVPLLGAPLLPMWWVKILTFLQVERFLWIISYKHVPNLSLCCWVSVFIN